MMKAQLIETCAVNLVCKCGSPNFRIFMETNEETDEQSDTVINNVECSACHTLFRLEYTP
jgi:hypothetical protein